MKNLLQWLGANDDVITKLQFEAMKIEGDQRALEAVTLPTFDDKPIPEDSILLSAMTVSEETIPAIQYVYSRGLTLDDYTFYVSKTLPDRVIIPYYFEGRVIGYTARKLSNGKPKYLSEQTPGTVFNLDSQNPSVQSNRDTKYVMVVEGPVDAISIGAVALLGAEIMDKQAMLINRLGKTVVVIPDRDKDGARTVEQAIENKWLVSMPDWGVDADGNPIKDVNDAVRKYGRLFTTYLIIRSIQTTELKIRLRAKKWFLEEQENT